MKSSIFVVRLNQLLDTRRRADGQPWTRVQLVEAVNSHGGQISTSYLSELLADRKDNPSHATVVAMALVFGVSVDYLSGITPEPPAPDIHRFSDTELAAEVAYRLGVTETPTVKLARKLTMSELRDVDELRALLQTALTDRRWRSEFGVRVLRHLTAVVDQVISSDTVSHIEAPADSDESAETAASTAPKSEDAATPRRAGRARSVRRPH